MDKIGTGIQTINQVVSLIMKIPKFWTNDKSHLDETKDRY